MTTARRELRPLGCVLLLAALSGCTVSRTPRMVAAHVASQELACATRRESGEPELALRFGRGLVALDPARPDAEALLSSGDATLDAHWQHPWLGSNVALRRPREADWGRRLLWWLPDRLLDLADLVSFDLGLGAGLGGDVHLTRAVQIGAGAGASVGLGWHGQRSLGVRVTESDGWALSLWGAGQRSGFDLGPGGRVVGGQRFDASGHHPDGLIYQEWLDYWAVGGSAHALLVSAEVELHPMQLFDLLAGLVGFDPLGDDLATTEAGELLPDEELGLLVLRETLVDEPTLAAWRAEARAARAARGTP